jgi:hypothetical protein
MKTSSELNGESTTRRQGWLAFAAADEVENGVALEN